MVIFVIFALLSACCIASQLPLGLQRFYKISEILGM